ncbi:MAG TPA: hypothetical protein VHX38_22880 [Pseudonocardiaceae bacterium]|jgi:hypothetical protein|nr:hypothetical protein [Pseudonocardiaceae bacterium]
MEQSSYRRGMLARVGCVVAAAGAALLLCGAGNASADAAPADAQAPQTSYSFTSAPGDYIGGGQSASYVAPAADITESGNTNELSFDVNSGNDDWTITLAAPVGEPFYPGTYLNAQRAEFRTGRAPGIDVWGDGRGCNTDYGQFTVYQVAFDASGNLTTFEAAFQQHCESPTAPVLSGTIRYQAQPLTYSYTSDQGDYIGAGTSQTYYNDTTTFGLTGTASGGIELSVSGLGDDWQINLVPPTGQTLQAGQEYDNAQRWPFQPAGVPGLSITGDGRGCNTLTGSFTINDLVTDANGTVLGLAATFTQHCEGAAPALHGTIEYLAGPWYAPQSGDTQAAQRRIRAS